MVVIRLTRGGAKKSPFYHVVVTDKRKPRDGSFIERVGYYNPTIKNTDNKYGLNLELARINYWIDNGAQPSDRVKYLIRSFVKLQQSQPASLVNAPSTKALTTSTVDTALATPATTASTSTAATT